MIAILDSGRELLPPGPRRTRWSPRQRSAAQRSQLPGAIHGWNFYDDNADPMDYFGHGSAGRGWPRRRRTTGRHGRCLAHVAPDGRQGRRHLRRSLREPRAGRRLRGRPRSRRDQHVARRDRQLEAAARGRELRLLEGRLLGGRDGQRVLDAPQLPDEPGHGRGRRRTRPRAGRPDDPDLPERRQRRRHQLRPGQPAEHLPPEGQLRQLRRASRPSPLRSTRSGRTSPTRPTASTSRARRRPRRTLRRRARSCGAPASAPACAEGTPTSAASSPRSAATRRRLRRRSAPTKCRQLLAYTATRVHNDDASGADEQLPAEPERRPDAGGRRVLPGAGRRPTPRLEHLGRLRPPGHLRGVRLRRAGADPARGAAVRGPAAARAGVRRAQGPGAFRRLRPGEDPDPDDRRPRRRPAAQGRRELQLEGAGRALPRAERGGLHERPGRVRHHVAGRRPRDLDPPDEHVRDLHAPVERRPAPVLVPRHLHRPGPEHGRQDRRRRVPEPDLDRIGADRHRSGPEQGAAAGGAPLRTGSACRLRPPEGDGRPRRQPVLPRRIRRGLADPVRPRGPRRAGRDRGDLRRPGARPAARRHAGARAGRSAPTPCRLRTTSR